MKLKTKVTLGVLFLFTVILTVGGLGLYYLHDLSTDARNIIKDNYESLEYMKKVVEASENLKKDSSYSIIKENIRAQQNNVTEPGEFELTQQLSQIFTRLKVHSGDSLNFQLRSTAWRIIDVNMQAINHKNQVALETANRATFYLILVVTIFSLAAFSFIVNFPGYVANPIAQLTAAIKSIANKNYEERLHFNRKDEFEELAESFNRMAEKLDDYESSNLAKILFEKKRIETIINKMHDPIIGLDENRNILFVNTEALKILGIAENELIGKYAPDVAVRNDLLRNLLKDLMDSSPHVESPPLKIFVDTKENYFSKDILKVTNRPTHEKNAQVIGYVIMLKNITPFKELDLAKTNFIATISHELKTPIASLQMCIKLLQDERVGKLNEEQSRIIQTLRDETSRLSKITLEFLDLAQVETGNIKLNLQTIHPNDIILQALEAVKFQAERKGIAIKKQLDENSPTVKADLDKSAWVLVNLLTNAIRYSPENGSINLNCVTRNNLVLISVEDFGSGIEAKYLNRLFEKFFQVPGTPSGSGLGLAISKEFIEAQGGHVNVVSEFGKGSTFSFTLLKAS